MKSVLRESPGGGKWRSPDFYQVSRLVPMPCLRPVGKSHRVHKDSGPRQMPSDFCSGLGSQDIVRARHQSVSGPNR